MSNQTYTTRSGRTVRKPVRFEDIEFLKGSNNGYTKGRLIDPCCAVSDQYVDTYLKSYTPRVIDQREKEEMLNQMFQDDEWVKLQLDEEHVESDEEEWVPEDDSNTDVDTEDSDIDEVDTDDDWAEDEPDDDVLTDGDYESDEEDSDDEEKDQIDYVYTYIVVDGLKLPISNTDVDVFEFCPHKQIAVGKRVFNLVNPKQYTDVINGVRRITIDKKTNTSRIRLIGTNVKYYPSGNIVRYEYR